jgi:hypothetical protein
MEYPLSPGQRRVFEREAGQNEVRSKAAIEGMCDCESSNTPVDDTLGPMGLCDQYSNASPIVSDQFVTPPGSTIQDNNAEEAISKQLEEDEVSICLSSDSVELLQPTVYPGPSPPLKPLSLSDLALPSVLPPKDTVFSAKPRDLIISQSSAIVEVPKLWYSPRDTPLIALHCRKELEYFSEPPPLLDKPESSRWSEYSPISSRSVSPMRGSVFGVLVEKMKKMVVNNCKFKGKTRGGPEPAWRATTFSWPGAGGMGYYAEGEAILQSASVGKDIGGTGGVGNEDSRVERGRGLWRHVGGAERKRERMKEEFKSRIRVVDAGS